MAKFIKIHEDDGEEIIINLESITTIEPETRHIDLVDCSGITIPRQNEWNKVMKFIYENEEV